VIEGRFFQNQSLALRRGERGSKKHGRPLLELDQPSVEGVGGGGLTPPPPGKDYRLQLKNFLKNFGALSKNFLKFFENR